MLSDVDQPALEQAVNGLRGQGFDAHGVVCDVRHLDEMVRLADEAFRLLGGVDVVFSNAGIVVAGPLAQMNHDDWRWVIDIDLWGSIHAVEAFLPRLLEQGTGGHIAFTASFAGLVPNAGLGTYGVAKYGVVGLAETLAREVKPNGIGVSVLCPMVVETKLVSNSERIRGADYGMSATPEGPSGRCPPRTRASAPTTSRGSPPTRSWPIGSTSCRTRPPGSRSAAGSNASTGPSTSRPPRAGRTR
ncbi:short chain dehydrogenase family protein [Mycobacterium avium subsp. avium 2285 (R)]|nr:short chain dehydrogenase family protein [Mycobacterium avium subsp. avium 2285 (R)]